MAPQSKAKVPFKANDSKEKFPQICRKSFYLILFMTKIRDILFLSGGPQIMAKSFKFSDFLYVFPNDLVFCQ